MPLRDDYYCTHSKRWYRYTGLDEPNEPPSADQAVDMVGVPLKVGDHVSWHIGGRYGAGNVFGVVAEITAGLWVPQNEINTMGPNGDYIINTVGFTARHRVKLLPLKDHRKPVTRDSTDVLHYVTPEMYEELARWRGLAE